MQRQAGPEGENRVRAAEASLEANQVANMPPNYYADDSQTGDVSCGAIMASACTQGRIAVDRIIHSPARERGTGGSASPQAAQSQNQNNSGSQS